MPKGEIAARKEEYFARLESLLDEYPNILLVEADNVGSNQFQKIRIALRGTAVVLMGKNTMIRKALRAYAAKNELIEKLLPFIKGNVGMVFTKETDIKSIRDRIEAETVGAPARAGAIAPCDVDVPAGNTGMDPSKTSFFQALNLATKINRGTIEIVSDVKLILEGEKVTPSQAALLQMMNIKPFTYGLKACLVYEAGEVYLPKVLDITEEDLIKTFESSITTIACISLAIGYPTLPAIPHVLINGYKNVLAIAIGTELSFDLADKVKDLLNNPEALAAMQAAAAAPAADAGGDAGGAAAAEEEEEEEDDDMGFGLFD
eukprot:Clim_evm16s7 gene=Clim_evmTU16s7